VSPDNNEHLWCQSYVDLTCYKTSFNDPNSKKYVNWPGAESQAPLLPAYPPGSYNSNLVKLLRAGHKNVVMTKEEMDKICCWIDLFVPFKGSYTESVKASYEVTDYNYWEGNRRIAQKEDSTNVAEFIKVGQPNGSATGITKPGPSNLAKPSGNHLKTYKILSVGASGRLSGIGFDQQVRVYDVRGALVPLRLQNGRFYAPRVAPGQYVVVPVK
jgi:hypothetical protein